MRCSVVFGVTLRLINISSPAINKLHHLLPTISVNLCDHGPAESCWQHLARRSVDSTSESIYRFIIAIYAYPPAFGASVMGFSLEYWHAIWYGKTRMARLPDGEKFLKMFLFVLSEFTNVTDRHTHTHTHTHTDTHTHRQTLHDDMARIASHGKNACWFEFFHNSRA